MAIERRPGPGSDCLGRGACCIQQRCLALLFAACLLALVGQAPVALAQPALPQDCPVLIPNGADCPGGGARMVPGPTQVHPGGGAIGSWTICINSTWLGDNFGALALFAFGKWPDWQANNGNWLLTLVDDGSGDPQGTNVRPFGATLPPPPCPPNPPPCTSCDPQVYATFFDFASFVPVTVVGGQAACPAGSAADAWCPPSVGNPVQLWVSGFVPQRGQNEVCQAFPNYLGLYDLYQVCLRWTLADRTSAPLLWDFDDEQVDAQTGQGVRQDGVNFNVPSGVGPNAGPAAHTFVYSSRFDPVAQCFRPPTQAAPQCGGVPGPAIPGYPQGTPAFQVQVATNWTLEASQCATTGGQTVCLNGTPWYRVDLTQLGAPHPWYATVSVVPIFVVAGGGVTP